MIGVELGDADMSVAMSRSMTKVAEEERNGRPEDRVLACIGPSPYSEEVVRAAHRLAGPCGSWVALHVRSPEQSSDRHEARTTGHLRLAESLGAECLVLVREDAAAAIVQIVSQKDFTRVIIGKSGPRRWSQLLRPSLVDRVIAGCEGVDVLVVRRELSEGVEEESASSGSSKRSFPRFLFASLITTMGSAAALGCEHLGFSEANVVLMHLLAVIATATTCGRGPTVLSSLLAVLSFNFFFTAPRRTFVIDDPQYLVTFTEMLLVGLFTSSLANRVRRQRKSGQAGQERANRLHELSRGLSAASGHESIAGVAAECLKRFVGGDVCVYMRSRDGSQRPLGPDSLDFEFSLSDIDSVELEARSVLLKNATDGDRVGSGLLLPLVTPDRTIGAIVSFNYEVAWNENTEDLRFVRMVASQLAFALAREQLTDEMHRARAETEAERLRSALLNSISHELRTPLAAILGAATSLLESRATAFDASKRELVEQVRDESKRLARLVENLLQMTRLESGQVTMSREWQVVEEVVGSAIDLVERRAPKVRIRAQLVEPLPLLFADGVLVELALTNLLENAAKHTLGESEILVEATASDGKISISIQDSGPGLSPIDMEHLFEKFYRGSTSRALGLSGAGLGLSIVDAVARLHGAVVVARNVTPRGVLFCIEFPAQQQPPRIELDAEIMREGEIS